MNDSFHLHTLPNASNKTPVLNKACSEVLSSCADSHQGEGRQRQRSADLSTTLMKHELRRNLFVERGPGRNTASAEENLLMPSGLTGVSAVNDTSSATTVNVSSEPHRQSSTTGAQRGAMFLQNWSRNHRNRVMLDDEISILVNVLEEKVKLAEMSTQNAEESTHSSQATIQPTCDVDHQADDIAERCYSGSLTNLLNYDEEDIADMLISRHRQPISGLKPSRETYDEICPSPYDSDVKTKQVSVPDNVGSSFPPVTVSLPAVENVEVCDECHLPTHIRWPISSTQKRSGTARGDAKIFLKSPTNRGSQTQPYVNITENDRVSQRRDSAANNIPDLSAYTIEKKEQREKRRKRSPEENNERCNGERSQRKENERQKRTNQNEVVQRSRNRRWVSETCDDDRSSESNDEVRSRPEKGSGRKRHFGRNYDGSSSDSEEVRDQRLHVESMSRRHRSPNSDIFRSKYRQSSISPRRWMKPEKFDGRSSFETFMCMFENCVQYNKWGERDKRAQLRGSLTGIAAQLLWDTDKLTYDELVEKLQARFGGKDIAERFQTELRYRRRQKGETIRELAQDIRRLMSLAYPREKSKLADQIARDAFLIALDDAEFEVKIREREPPDLDTAEKIAQRCEVARGIVDATSNNRHRFTRQIVEEEKCDVHLQGLEVRLNALEQQLLPQPSVAVLSSSDHTSNATSPRKAAEKRNNKSSYTVDVTIAQSTKSRIQKRKG